MAVDLIRQVWDSEADAKRRQEAHKVLKFWRNDWDSLLATHLKRLFKPQTLKRLRVVADPSWNIARWASRQIGAVYNQGATRRVGDTLVPDTYLAGGALDMSMKAAAQLLPLAGNLFTRVLPVALDSGAPHLAVDIITPDRCTVLEDPQDPHGLQAIVYQVGGGDKARLVYWSPTHHWVFRASDWSLIPNPDNPTGRNPYGMIPVTPHRYNWRVGGFWDPKCGQGLIDATLQAGAGLTGLSYLLKVANHRQLWVSGEPDKDYPLNQILDAATPVVLGPDGQVGVLDLQPNFASIIETLVARAGAVLNLYGIRPEALRGTMDASSGVALKIKQTDLETERSGQRSMWRMGERRQYQVAAAVAGFHFGETYPTDGPLVVEYPDVGPQQSAQERSSLYLPWVQAGKVPDWWGIMHTFQVDEETARKLADEARQNMVPPLVPDVQL